MSKLRVLLDANIVCAGCVWPRFPYEVLEHAIRGDYQMVLTQEIIEEAREAIAEIAPGRMRRLDAVLESSAYEEATTPTRQEIAENAGLVRDIEDVHVALAAINSTVDFLISLDRDLTDPAEPIHQKLKILLPAAFLRHYMGWSSDDLEAIRHRTWDDLSDEE